MTQPYLARIQLWSDGYYATPGLSWDAKTMSGRPFSYFAYGAATAEVVAWLGATPIFANRPCCCLGVSVIGLTSPSAARCRSTRRG